MAMAVEMPKKRSFSRPRRFWASFRFLSISSYASLLIAFSLFLFFLSFRKTDIEPKNRISSTSHSEPTTQVLEKELWNAPFSYGFLPCVNMTHGYIDVQISDRYITVRSNGGLNQMRMGIADMVAITHIMNATLVLPELDKRSFWRDSSTFSDIFDELHFITSLQRHLNIVKELPEDLISAPRARKHFSSWSNVGYYEEMTRLWKDYRVNLYKVIYVPKCDSRLSNNDLPLYIQKLRCRALYHALKFSPTIENLGKKLVERLKSRGRYIALHLRYEKDMLSFTGCTYGLTREEADELRIMRENTNHWKVKKINATEQRIGGYCPLTPKEVGIFLQALGYPPSTWIYVAAGEIYGGETHLSELRSYYPNLIFKEMVASPEELLVFSNHATQSAALDYIISIESDVFLPSYSGNMARAVEGHRRFLGYRKTVTPDRKGLVEIFDKLEEEGPRLSKLVRQMHKDRWVKPQTWG